MLLLTLAALLALPQGLRGMYMEGEMTTGDNWVFMARFCFLSLDGKFEYDIEYPKVRHRRTGAQCIQSFAR